MAAATLLLVLPFTGLHDYADALRRLGQVFDQDSYNVYGLLVQAGASGTPWRASAMLVVGAALSRRRRGGTGASRSRFAAAFALSPSSWLDYFTLAALPLALARPRVSGDLVSAARDLGCGRAPGSGSATCAPIFRVLLVFCCRPRGGVPR